jgi:uncharacterized membrane protein YphA (DoxX/SURF4 family)
MFVSSIHKQPQRLIRDNDVACTKELLPGLNGGQLAILFCFVFLYLAVAGGGEWSTDELLTRSRAR